MAAAAANAYAARNWLGSKLNAQEALAAINQVAVHVHRANDVISGITALFKSEEKGKSGCRRQHSRPIGLDLLELYLRRQNIELEPDLAPDLPPVEGNDVQLQQVLLNIIANAIDAMESGPLRKLTVRSQRSETGGVRVTHSEDTGTAIDSGQARSGVQAAVHDQGKRHGDGVVDLPSARSRRMAVPLACAARGQGGSLCPIRIARHARCQIVCCCIATRCFFVTGQVRRRCREYRSATPWFNSPKPLDFPNHSWPAAERATCREEKHADSDVPSDRGGLTVTALLAMPTVASAQTEKISYEEAFKRCKAFLDKEKGGLASKHHQRAGQNPARRGLHAEISES